MQENQYILKPVGILDRSSASSLFERMRDKRERPILVDCADMRGALHEGAMELVGAMAGWTGEACRFENLPEMLAVRFQLAGFPVSRRTVSIPAKVFNDESSVPPAPQEAVETSLPAELDNVVPCGRCESPVRIPRPGLYACPHCGAHFHADLNGRSIVYEPLVRLDH